MKSFSYLFLFILLISLPVLAQDGYERTVIPVDTTVEKGGYGAVVGGYDFDGDGKKEIYAVNTNTVDRPEELIVITSYSIHYTKLYERHPNRQRNPARRHWSFLPRLMRLMGLKTRWSASA